MNPFEAPFHTRKHASLGKMLAICVIRGCLVTDLLLLYLEVKMASGGNQPSVFRTSELPKTGLRGFMRQGVSGSCIAIAL